MARAIKKVNVEGKTLRNKWVYISVISVIVAVIAGISIWLGVYYSNLSKDESFDALSDYSSYKTNYDVVLDKVDDEAYSDVFVFVYDDSTFAALSPFADTESIKQVDVTNQTNLLNEVKNFAAKLDELQGDGIAMGVKFYIVNASLTGNDKILTDTSLGNFTVAPALIYFHGDSFSSTTKDEEEVTISDSGIKNVITCFKEAKKYLEVIENI